MRYRSSIPVNAQVIVEADFAHQAGSGIGHQMMVLEGQMVILDVGVDLKVNRCHSQIEHLQTSRLQANLII